MRATCILNQTTKSSRWHNDLSALWLIIRPAIYPVRISRFQCMLATQTKWCRCIKHNERREEKTLASVGTIIWLVRASMVPSRQVVNQVHQTCWWDMHNLAGWLFTLLPTFSRSAYVALEYTLQFACYFVCVHNVYCVLCRCKIRYTFLNWPHNDGRVWRGWILTRFLRWEYNRRRGIYVRY